MSLSDQDVERIAKLARLAVSAAELPAVRGKLNAILGVIDQMQAVDTQGVEPLAHPTAFAQQVALRLREDVVTEPSNKAEAEATRARNMQNAPAQQDGLFLVPRVIE
ncbi:MAG: Asp-tRNA(Asn)/Glu-tRNA(Gln) amidotransferase subunit GatC [Burkholderiaceae bacterium]